MKQRGRKSTAELSVVRPLSTELPAPPDQFDDDQAQAWAEIVATKDPDWWDAGTFPLLEAYVKTIVEYRKVSKLVEGCHPVADATAFDQYDKIQKTQDRLASQLCRLATKMRLSQQSKYGARGAEGASNPSGNSGTPWQ